MTEFYDIHCHFLPGVDDGCQSAEESERYLDEQWKQGCRGIIATPHYYARESIEAFAERRKRAIEQLEKRLAASGKEEYLKHMGFAAEVAYYNGMTSDRDLEKLFYGSSRYMLLEMPFSEWRPNVLRDVQTLCARGIIPVIAHMERFTDIATRDQMQQLMDMPVIIQINAGNFNRHGADKRFAMKLLTNGTMQAIGSDAHNMTTRRPNIGPALEVMEDAGYEREMLRILSMNRRIYEAAAAAAEPAKTGRPDGQININASDGINDKKTEEEKRRPMIDEAFLKFRF